MTGNHGMDSSQWGLYRTSFAVLYYPRLQQPDPLQKDRKIELAPCGAVAGIIARIDTDRGIWKAPAGKTARFNKKIDPTINLDDHDSERLNPLAVNCLRTFPDSGTVIWGARTLEGAESLNSELSIYR